MNGIDVSMYQKDIEFSKIPDVIKYIYIKATEGVNYVDPSFIALYNKVKTTNKLYGFYHFMSEKTDPSQQAIDFYNAIKDKSYILIPVLDIESNTLGRSKTQVTDRALQFLRKFKELSNMDCIVYTYTSFANSYLDKRLSSYKCWIADYNKSQTVKPNYVWNSFVGHQYSGSGSVKGYNGQIDLNNFSNAIELNSKVTVNTNVATTNKANKIVFNTHLRDFQSAYNKSYNKNILVDGLWGVQSNNAVNSVILKQFMSNDLVGWVQIRIGKCSVDGIFGPVTKQAVMEYQKSHGLAVDGIVGPNTLKTILKQYGVNI